MALRIYSGGTVNMKDGILVSNGDESAPIIYQGMYPGSADVQVNKKLCIRADNGEVWRDVTLYLIKGSADYFDKSYSGSMRMSLSGGPWQYSGVWEQATAQLYFHKITDTNTIFDLWTFVKPTDSGSPDISYNLYVSGRRTV